MKDLYNNIEAVSVLNPITISETAVHTDIDLAGFNSCVILINTGADAGTGLSASHKLVFTMDHSDDGTTYTAVTTADMLDLTVSSGVVLTIDSTDEDNTLYKLGYIGGKRYLQLTYTETGDVSMPMSIIVVKGHPLNAPVA
jgi:hypothetical protein